MIGGVEYLCLKGGGVKSLGDRDGGVKSLGDKGGVAIIDDDGNETVGEDTPDIICGTTVRGINIDGDVALASDSIVGSVESSSS